MPKISFVVGLSDIRYLRTMSSKKKLSHIDESGNPSMVNVAVKKISKRTAVAEAVVVFPSDVIKQLVSSNWQNAKGSVLQVANIAGIMGAKKTSDLIPLCHPLGLDHIDIKFEPVKNEIRILCTASVESKTGVEMEALTGASVAALAIYDMCKALSPEIEIKSVRLISKSGGSNDFRRK